MFNPFKAMSHWAEERQREKREQQQQQERLTETFAKGIEALEAAETLEREHRDYNPMWEGGPSNPTPEQRLEHAGELLNEHGQSIFRRIENGTQEYREGRGETADQMWKRHNDERWDMDTAAHSDAGQEMPSQQNLRHRVERKDRDFLERNAQRELNRDGV